MNYVMTYNMYGYVKITSIFCNMLTKVFGRVSTELAEAMSSSICNAIVVEH
jgi:hypothetical protein